MALEDSSGFGTIVNIVASNTFPTGFNVTQFTEDADPLDMPAIRIADTAMGVNGDLIKWAKAVTLPAVLNVIPGSLDDQNLQILFDANRVSQTKISAQDVITLTAIYPDGSSTTLITGTTVEYMTGKSVAGSGRLKTKSYTFSFGDKIGV